MKKVQAIVRASHFEEVVEALAEKDIRFFTFYEVKGYGHQRGEEIHYRGAVYDVGYIARIKIELIVSDEFSKVAIDAIQSAAHSGEKGDGIIYVTPCEYVQNIRTEQTNGDAINK